MGLALDATIFLSSTISQLAFNPVALVLLHYTVTDRYDTTRYLHFCMESGPIGVRTGLAPAVRTLPNAQHTDPQRIILPDLVLEHLQRQAYHSHLEV